uniref:Sec-independent protein translocase component TatC n=1 Tax=Bostrychia tenuissima TaxID=196631 RepID=UPI002E7A4F68|nr:Sec-independent protein translocase component TatC [Bostrychia tenuissima]WQF69450.1 Sec-independent protein translocase component TatC [Bostrychia tenuissima]
MKLNKYFWEMNVLTIYNIICLFTTLFISFYKIISTFMFFIYPVLKMTKKKLTILQLFDFMNSSWSIAITSSLYFETIYLFFTFNLFFSNVWYFQQIYLFNKFTTQQIYCSVPMFFIFLYFCIFMFIKTILLFKFANLNYTTSDIFETQTQLSFLMSNLTTFYFNVLFFFSIIFIGLSYSTLFISFTKSYFKFKHNKNYICFTTLLFCLTMFSDTLTQLVVLAVNMLTFEIVFFYFCYKISSHTFWLNGYTETVIEKSKV